MTEAQTQRITYQGNPALVDALAELLREEGVEVQPFDAPDERRDISGIAPLPAAVSTIWWIRS